MSAHSKPSVAGGKLPFFQSGAGGSFLKTVMAALIKPMDAIKAIPQNVNSFTHCMFTPVVVVGVIV